MYALKRQASCKSSYVYSLTVGPANTEASLSILQLFVNLCKSLYNYKAFCHLTSKHLKCFTHTLREVPLPLTLIGCALILCLMCTPFVFNNVWHIRRCTYSPLRHKSSYRVARRGFAACISTTVLYVVTLVVIGDRAPESGMMSGWWYIEIFLVMLVAFHVALTVTVALCVVSLQPRPYVQRKTQDKLWAYSVRVRHVLVHYYGGCGCR
jgi:hypothetical protein